MPDAMPASRFYRPELDVLRFVAVAMVFLSHVFPPVAGDSRFLVALKTTGFAGVDLFFALSAYLITELLQRERRRTATVDLRAFYLRRALRIWPLYFTALGVAAAVANVRGAPLAPATIAAFVLLCGNWATALHGFLGFGFGPLWSVSVEEQFYLVWPRICRAASRRALLGGCAILWCASQLATALLCLAHARVSPVVWTDSFVHLQDFALGAGVSLALRSRLPGWRWPRRALLVATGASLVLAANALFASSPTARFATLRWTLPGYALVALGATLVLTGILGAQVPARCAPGVWLGKISYGLYVTHVPCVSLVGVLAIALGIADASSAWRFELVAGAPLTIVVSALSYRFLEAPFLRLKARYEVIRTRPA